MKFTKAILLALSLHAGIATANNSAESLVLCTTESTSTTGVTFQYQLFAPAHALANGDIRIDDENARLDVISFQLPSVKVTPLLNGAKLVYVDAGAGHARFKVDGSKHGLIVELSSTGRSFSIKHNINGTEVLESASTCEIAIN